MRLVFLLLLFHFSVQSQLFELKDFGDNPGNLSAYYFLPENVEEYNALVVVLHGCSQDAEEIAHHSNWNALAEEHGFAVLYPEQKMGNNVSLCFNWFLEKDMQDNGECKSIHQMMRKMHSLYPITQRNYCYGVSAGAAMTNILLINYPTEFQGGAILAGGPYGLAKNGMQGWQLMKHPEKISNKELIDALPDSIDTSELPKIVILHGEEDKVVAFENGILALIQWYALHEPKKTFPQIIENSTSDNPILKQEFGENKQLIFYRIVGLGHQLPIDSVKQTIRKKKRLTKDVEFYSTYFIGKDLGVF